MGQSLHSPEVSIVTVCFNSCTDNPRNDRVGSIQDYPAIQYIVIDGGSTDGTVEIIRQYKEKISVFVSESDRGIYDAMNKGIRLATGKIVGTLNSDDFYADTHVVTDLIRAMVEGNVDAVFAGPGVR